MRTDVTEREAKRVSAAAGAAMAALNDLARELAGIGWHPAARQVTQVLAVRRSLRRTQSFSNS